MSDHDDNDDYEVGYGKPPKRSQWKPGQSGNPKGSRGRVDTSLGEVFAKEMQRPREVQLNDKKVRVLPDKIAARQLYDKACGGDTGTFERILRVEARVLRDACALSDQKGFSESPFEDTVCVWAGSMGRPWKSHCDDCGKLLYDEIDAARIRCEARGETMSRVRYNGPKTAEEKARFEHYRSERDEADRQRRQADAETGPGTKPKKRRRSGPLTFAELVFREGNRRISVKKRGKLVKITKREFAAQRQAAKAIKGDLKAIRLREKYADQLVAKGPQSKPTPTRFEEQKVIDVTPDFDDKPPLCYCAACQKALDEWIASERAKYGA